MLWAGFQHDPWVSSDGPLGNALLITGRHLVGASYELKSNGGRAVEVARVSCFQEVITDTHIPLKASQRLCDGWRTFFGSTALQALHIFFEEQELDTYKDRVKWAAGAMKTYRHLYRKVKDVWGPDGTRTLKVC